MSFAKGFTSATCSLSLHTDVTRVAACSLQVRRTSTGPGRREDEVVHWGVGKRKERKKKQISHYFFVAPSLPPCFSLGLSVRTLPTYIGTTPNSTWPGGQ
ncbi:hypothetical protein LX36DRAFT_433929 [Colletotrichum falcatum]|nr:hypothetical protein LX36DRAFT_433929 [Colletotrichum falcatum]